MKSFYSILNIAPNPTANESISVGLILVSPIKIWVKFSDKKMRIVKSLLEVGAGNLEWIEKQIIRKVREQNILLQNNSTSLQLFKYDNFLHSEYFNYLNVYSNNLLQFSKPILVKNHASEELFNKFYSILVSKDIVPDESIMISDRHFREKLEEKLIKPVASKVHTHQKFTAEQLPSLYFSYEMDCIGLNGVFTGAKAVNFDMSFHTIDSQLSHYFALTDILERKYQKHGESNNFYLIADEPFKKNTKEHDSWQRIRQQNKFKVISSDESTIVVEKIESTGAQTFLES